MDSPRAHTPALIFLGLAVLALGFCLGSLITGFLLAKRNRAADFEAGSTVMSKRMSAIKKAVREGRSDYEFEVSGFQPVLK